MTASISCHYAGTSGARHAIVQIRHDGKLNAMSRAMWRELRTVFLQLQQETTVPDPLRCVMVQGVDGHFCAGGDISEYQSFRFDPDSLRLFHEEEVWGGLSAMLACDAPLIAAIDGNCMGAGVEISSCCDIRIATATSERVYQAGDVFHLAAEEPHSEFYGMLGVQYLVGRKTPAGA